MIYRKNITGIILAGGKSSRMGLDKGLLQLNGTTFISHILNAVKPLVSDIIIVSNNIEYDVFGHKRVDDIIKNAGPVAGLHSGLSLSETKYNLVLSCDIPLIKTNILKKLIEGNNDNFDIIQLQSQGKTMPLIGLYKKKCAHKFLELLQGNERRLRYAVDQLNTKTIKLNAEFDHYVKNINTKEQFNELKHAIEY